MKLRLSLLATIIGVALSACGGTASSRYNVIYPALDSEDGLCAYIVDYDTGEKIDSAVISDGRAYFSGTVETPVLARLLVDGKRTGVFILEKGDIKVDGRMRIAGGSPLNDSFTRYIVKADSIETAFEALPLDAPEAKRTSLKEAYEHLNNSILASNADNPIGYYIFLQQAYEWDAPTLAAKLEQMPQFASYRRIINLAKALEASSSTGSGNYYKDFSITYNDSIYKLSDYVGKNGCYTLVDFWASWCGPCIKETRTIKELYNRYGNGNGLNVVGVAVWDEPENTLKAIKVHKLPWNQIINAGTIPTDLYGISGIPCIMLIDPYGRIVNRGLQGADLVNAVDSALSEWSAPDPTEE